MAIASVMPSSHLVLCHPLPLLPSIFPSIRVFSNKSVACDRWPKYWSFSFSIRPSNEYLGLIFFRIDWFDLIAAQGTLKSLLQYHNSKASILHFSPEESSAFLMVQLSQPYMTTGILPLSVLYVFTKPLLNECQKISSSFPSPFFPTKSPKMSVKRKKYWRYNKAFRILGEVADQSVDEPPKDPVNVWCSTLRPPKWMPRNV